jgi:Rrf2 family protein
MITKEADYAIRMVLYLASCRDAKSPVSTQELAEAMDIPYRFLRRIVSRMVKAGLVRTTRGRGGGLHPARSPAQISLLDVLHAISPRSLQLSPCIERQNACGRAGICPVRREVAVVQSAMQRQLGRIRFSALKTRRRQGAVSSAQ